MGIIHQWISPVACDKNIQQVRCDAHNKHYYTLVHDEIPLPPPPPALCGIWGSAAPINCRPLQFNSSFSSYISMWVGGAKNKWPVVSLNAWTGASSFLPTLQYILAILFVFLEAPYPTINCVFCWRITVQFRGTCRQDFLLITPT